MLQGKGFFIWKVPACENGDPQAIANLAQAAQLTHVLIKIANTTGSYNVYEGVDYVQPVAQALRERNIQVYGWHYVTGDNPLGEANIAIQRVQQLHLDGYVIDAEKEYRALGKAEAARKFMARLRVGLPNTPIALSSYRYPSYHPQLPWREFLEKCDLNMPQVYWLHAHNPGEQLTRCVREFQAMTPYRPIIPTGAAYTEFGWKPTPDEETQFMQTAQNLNLTAANFYSWDSSRKYLPTIWDAIRDYPWSPQPPTFDITGQYIAALNTHNPDQLVNLYTPSAVHITANRTIQGQAAIRSWYNTLLTELLPNATFNLTGFSSAGNSRHFTWTATSSQGNVHNGNDTFGLSDTKIAYHFTSYTISA